MRSGKFEEREGKGGEKYYRLTWDPRQPSLSTKESSLSPKEVMACLFTRYLISRGKLDEFKVSTRTNRGSASPPRKTRRRRADSD